MRKVHLLSVGLTLALSVVTVTSALAVPPLPYTTYGTVKVRGNDIPNNSVVKAYKGATGALLGSTKSVPDTQNANHSSYVVDASAEGDTWTPSGSAVGPAGGFTTTYTIDWTYWTFGDVGTPPFRRTDSIPALNKGTYQSGVIDSVNLDTPQFTFDDVPPTAWFWPWVQGLTNIAKGDKCPDGNNLNPPENTYCPYRSLRRIVFASQVLTYLGIVDQAHGLLPYKGYFSDLSNIPLAPYAETFYRLGYIGLCNAGAGGSLQVDPNDGHIISRSSSPNPEPQLCPNNIITRKQMTRQLDNVKGWSVNGWTYKGLYSDNPQSDVAFANYVEVFVCNGGGPGTTVPVVSHYKPDGTPDCLNPNFHVITPGVFQTNANVTRGVMARNLSQVFNVPTAPNPYSALSPAAQKVQLMQAPDHVDEVK